MNSIISISILSAFLFLGCQTTKVPMQGSTAPDHPADHAAPHSPAPHEHHRKVGPVSAEKSMNWLKNGNKRFRTGNVRHDGQDLNDVLRLSKGQKPHAIVVSCSDSRVPPEIVFDEKLGEIFVVRTAGQSFDDSAIASIEYAVAHLGSNLIVVMGHESCGAVDATLSMMKGQTDLGSPFLNHLAENITPRLAHVSLRQPASEHLEVEGWANVKGAALELLTKSEIIRTAVQQGSLKLTTALYHLSTGNVEWKE